MMWYVLRSLSTTAEFLISLGLLLLLTLREKNECANKVADFTAPFMKKMASNVGPTWQPDSARIHWSSLEHGHRPNMHSEVIKVLHGCFVHVGKTLTDLQILGCELHQNTFGGRAPPGPAGGAIALPRPLSRY